MFYLVDTVANLPTLSYMTPIKAIIAARKARSWSQSDLSRVSGVHRSNINSAESGRRPAGVKVLGRLAAALGLELETTVKERKR